MEKNTQYGEVLGTERYQLVGDNRIETTGNHVEILRDSLEMSKKPEGLSQFCYHGGFYYIQGGYIWHSDENGDNIGVIGECPYEAYGTVIYVNRYGIYVINGKSFTLFDFNGVKKTEMETDLELVDYYICDDRIYFIANDTAAGEYAVQSYDTTRKKYRTFLKMREKKGGYSSEYERYDSKGAQITNILANNKRIVFRISCWNYIYTGDEVIEADSGTQGWYSLKFGEDKAKSIDHRPAEEPHLVLSKPEKFDYFEPFGKPAISIASFDMENDIMWVRRTLNGQEVWEPRNIDVLSMQRKTEQFPCWRIADEGIHGGYNTNRTYFDGKNLYRSDGTLRIYSYNEAGERSDDWYLTDYQNAENFRVFEDYLFFCDTYLTECHYRRSHSLTRPEPIRESWMGDTRDSLILKKREEAISRYQAGPTKEAAVFSGPETPSRGASGNKLNKEEYWKEFVEYAFHKSDSREFKNAGFPVAPTADRSWYELRMGSAKVHIELSFSTQKKTIRTALLITDRELLGKLEEAVARTSVGGKVTVDRESKTMTINILQAVPDFAGDRTSQFDWYMSCACIFKAAADRALGR